MGWCYVFKLLVNTSVINVWRYVDNWKKFLKCIYGKFKKIHLVTNLASNKINVKIKHYAEAKLLNQVFVKVVGAWLLKIFWMKEVTGKQNTITNIKNIRVRSSLSKKKEGSPTS